jgi:hypothetical protein
LLKMLVTWRSTARSLDVELAGDRLVRPALGHQAQHLALPVRQRIERVLVARAPEHLRTTSGPAPSPPRDSLDRLGEPLDLGDPILEQVADALRPTGKQLPR